MITTNADWREAARNALHLTSEAVHYSDLVSSTFRNPHLRVASNAAATASNLGNSAAMIGHENTQSELYRALLAHEAARSAHEAMSSTHRGVQDRWRAQHGDFAPGPEPRRRYSDAHYRHADLHDKAAEAHSLAARAAARQLGMDEYHYGIHQALRDQMKKNPYDPTPGKILADLVEQHGLPKEANRLRLDPTGHIGRAVRAYNRFPGATQGRGDRSHMKRSIAASIRANRLGTKTSHETAAQLATRAGDEAYSYYHMEGNNAWYRPVPNELRLPFYRLSEYHQQQLRNL